MPTSVHIVIHWFGMADAETEIKGVYADPVLAETHKTALEKTYGERSIEIQEFEVLTAVPTE